MSKPFKLRLALYGHSLDVRTIAISATNAILSGSRDKTAKLWIPTEYNQNYSEAVTYKGQQNFVTSVLCLPKTNEFCDGVVLTGGNDNNILVYKPQETIAAYSLSEHTNSVCCLSKGTEPDSFLSSSWDGTAKLWRLTTESGSSITLSGHTAAVWSVIQLQNTNIVTASADKTIGIYSKDGHRINTIQAHTDCVRGLSDFPELNCFLSCSNDATIKVWTYSGSNVNTYYGHTNYIYSIARNTAGGENCFVTSDEDRTVRYWKDGVNTETITLPAQSVWAVGCLTNGDIVTGSSDGVVRIFTQDESRYASDSELHNYEEAINAWNKQTTQQIGGYKISDLPGKEALYEPGKRPGQMKIVREANSIVAYTWVDEGENSHWDKVGDVLGAANPESESKTTYEGKVYDFVFSVDVEDGKPPLQLPYNKGNDPYTAAHNFLEKNMLPPAYLDQVVDFILRNSKDSNEASQSSSEYVDPFTGASRYTPHSNSAASSSGNAGVNMDPLTGGNSYSSSHGTSTVKQTVSKTEDKFFPQQQYRGFDSGDPKVILAKLKEFNAQAGNAVVDESRLDNLVKLCCGPISDDNSFDTLFDLFNWSDEMIFPVLDVIRMAVRYPANHQKILQYNNSYLIEKLKYYVSSNCKAPSSTLVSFRILCNLFTHQLGEQLIFTNRVSFLENVTGLGRGNKNIQIAMATFLLNITLLCMSERDEFGILLLANILPDINLSLDDPEAQFRGLVAIGTLICGISTEQKTITKNKIKENGSFISKLSTLADERVTDVEFKTKRCAAQVVLELNS